MNPPCITCSCPLCHSKSLTASAGGSAGIGKATALAFDKNGCKVAILGRRKERLDAVVSCLFGAPPSSRSGGPQLHLVMEGYVVALTENCMHCTPEEAVYQMPQPLMQVSHMRHTFSCGAFKDCGSHLESGGADALYSCADKPDEARSLSGGRPDQG